MRPFDNQKKFQPLRDRCSLPVENSDLTRLVGALLFHHMKRRNSEIFPSERCSITLKITRIGGSPTMIYSTKGLEICHQNIF